MTSTTNTADNNDRCDVKVTDLWIDVNGVATRVLCWGQPIDLNGSHDLKKVVICVCGNPGLSGFYRRFLFEIHRALNIPVWVLSHAGKIFSLQFKLLFVEKYIPIQTSNHYCT